MYLVYSLFWFVVIGLLFWPRTADKIWDGMVYLMNLHMEVRESK